ncbi:MAG: SDR family oxidoreductase [Candidatus Hodarchaeales archaeon]
MSEPLMKARICMITGANSGIGKITALELAKMDAHIIMVCRNKNKGILSQREILERTGNPNIDLMVADLSSQASIRNFVDKFREQYETLHILIQNAGTIAKKRLLTTEGLETTFATNYLGPFLLTNLLLDVLITSAPSRIISISSGMHHRASIDLEDLQSTKAYKNINAYSISKLANILFIYELHHRLRKSGVTNVTSNAVHPGFIRTNFGMNGLNWFQKLGMKIVHPFLAISPQEGAETSIYVASSPEVENISGEYFAKKKVSESSPLTHDRNLQKKLWKISEELTGLSSKP